MTGRRRAWNRTKYDALRRYYDTNQHLRRVDWPPGHRLTIYYLILSTRRPKPKLPCVERNLGEDGRLAEAGYKASGGRHRRHRPRFEEDEAQAGIVGFFTITVWPAMRTSSFGSWLLLWTAKISLRYPAP